MYTGVTPAGTNKLPLHNTNVMPFYYALVPVPTTAGTITLLGAGTDVGVLISSTNPSFIPVAPNTSSSGHVPTTQMINVALSQNTAIMVAVV